MWMTTPLPIVRAWPITPRMTSAPPSGVIGTVDSPVPGMSNARILAGRNVASATRMVCTSIFQVSTPPLAMTTGASAGRPGAAKVCTGTSVVPPR